MQICDVCRVFVAVMKLKLINAQENSLFFRFGKLLAVNGVFLFQALKIDVLDGILAKTGKLGNLFQSHSGVRYSKLQIKKIICK